MSQQKSKVLFRNMPLGKNQLTPRFKVLCYANGVKGDVLALNVSGHSARKTMIQWMTEAGHSVASIAKGAATEMSTLSSSTR